MDIYRLGKKDSRTGVMCHSVPITQCFLHCLVNTQKTGKTRLSVCPYCQVTACFVNVLLGNTRICETLKNVTPALRT
jgi:hypothetical protein